LRALYWTAPLLFTLVLYWNSLNAWFVQDDFVWLYQLARVDSLAMLGRAIFEPTVQGTLRPWSDRVFFLVFQSFFGLNAFPYHAWIFLTQFVNLILLASVVRRLTGRRSAAILAPLLWTGNAVLVMTLSWACLYKDILCSFFLLLAFYLFLRHIESGARRFYVWQWVVFILGFGAMETNAVYPGIAVSFAILCAPKHIRKAVLLLIPSALYLVLNGVLVKKQAAGPYAMHFDSFLPINFLRYWALVLKPDARLLEDRWTAFVLPAIATIALAGFVVRQWRNGRRLPAFFLLWFVFTIAPVVPLREQFQTYYATVASIGVAMLAADAISYAWSSPTRAWRVVATALAIAFLIPSVDLAHAEARKWRARGRRAEQLVTGVVAARELHPEDTIVLDGVDSALFWDVLPDGGFRAAGISNVYLSPGSERTIERRPFFPDPSNYVIPLEALQRDPEHARVYYAAGDTLHEITRPYLERILSTESLKLPRRVDVTAPGMDSLLSGEWYPPDAAHRWMAKRAGIRMAGPEKAGESLHVVAVCPRDFLADGPITLTVSVDGQPLRPVDIHQTAVDVSLPLPAELLGKQVVQVTLAVSRTHTPPNDGRALGIAIRVVEIR
jgi:hypothetical protein